MSAEEIDCLSVEDLLEIAAGVMDDVALTDAGLLAAAQHPPRATVFGDHAHPTFQDKAAALLHSLAATTPPQMGTTGSRGPQRESSASSTAGTGPTLSTRPRP